MTGPDADALHPVADGIADALAARGLPVESFDARTPGIEVLTGAEEGERIAFIAGRLSAYGVAAVVALPSTRRARDAARAALGRLIEVHVHRERDAADSEAPERAEVEILLPEPSLGAGTDRTLRTLELLGFLTPPAGASYSPEEERAVIRRLKAFGYL